MKAVLFDIDGVLVETRELHRDAFITALASVGLTMTPEEHAADFNGLPTTVKIERLIASKRLCACKREVVIETKQMLTERLIAELQVDPTKRELVELLLLDGYRSGAVSNAIRSTVVKLLDRLQLLPLMEVVISNEDVKATKPAPDGWLAAMRIMGVTPDETLILEDSPPGIASAYASGAHVMEVTGPDEVTSERVFSTLGRLRRGSEQRQGLAETGQSLWGDGALLRASPIHAVGAAGD